MLTSKILANSLRFLSIDAIQKANSGHPGMPMGMAEIAEVLWRTFLKHNPANPRWINRDRFVLSNGHGSMLLYSLLHLTGYDLTIDDLKNFRQLNSKTPGHPEYGHTPGVEMTTGPLGQGLASAVGMALAEKILAARFNRSNYSIIDHYTYVFLGDGCLMEGLSHEACSFAGTHRLGKLIAFWDNNHISIDGRTEGWFTDNVPQRFEAYGWHVITNVDGYDPDAIHKAITDAKFVSDRPTLICCNTVIAYGAPHLCNSSKTHGAPLGDEEITAARKNLDWSYPPFIIPEEIYTLWNARPKGALLEQKWQNLFTAYTKDYPDLAKELLRRFAHQLPNNWEQIKQNHLQKLLENSENIATRKASQNCLQAYAPHLPELLGGSADLTESNATDWVGTKAIRADDADGNYLHYGVREFGMFCMMSGLALHGGFIPFGGTFLVFSDYGLNGIRLAALMRQKSIFVLTHDSIGLGEDGPTHQPIGQLSALRSVPKLSIWRPCDPVETAIAWQYALENQGPTCLILTRQKLKQQINDPQKLTVIKRGGYILVDCEKAPQAILIATGSEVELATLAAQNLAVLGYQVRVVSMPSADVFAQQDVNYQNSVLPKEVELRVAIEAAYPDFWYKYVGLKGLVLGVNDFGKSAPYQEIYRAFGLTVDNLIEQVKTRLSRRI